MICRTNECGFARAAEAPYDNNIHHTHIKLFVLFITSIFIIRISGAPAIMHVKSIKILYSI